MTTKDFDGFTLACLCALRDDAELIDEANSEQQIQIIRKAHLTRIQGIINIFERMDRPCGSANSLNYVDTYALDHHLPLLPDAARDVCEKYLYDATDFLHHASSG